MFFRLSKPIFRAFLFILGSGLMFPPSITFGEDSPTNTLPIYSSNSTVAIVDGKPINFDSLKDAGVQQMLVSLHKRQDAILKGQILKRLITNHPELARIKIQRLEEKH